MGSSPRFACIQAKEFLSRHHIAYLPRDVDADSAASQELTALGFRTVPVVVLPGQPPIPGFNARALSAAIGIGERVPEQRLGTVMESFDRVLAALLGAMAQLGNADLILKMPNRARKLGELVHDVFYKALTWVPEDGRVARRDAVGQHQDANRYPDVASLRRSGEAARAVLRERFAPQRGDADRLVETPDGSMTLTDAVVWLANPGCRWTR